MNAHLDQLRALSGQAQQDRFYRFIEEDYRRPSVNNIMMDFEKNFDERQKSIFDNNLRTRLLRHRRDMDSTDKNRYRVGLAMLAVSNIFVAWCQKLAWDTENKSRAKQVISQFMPMRLLAYKRGLYVVFPLILAQSLMLINFNNKIAYKYTFIDQALDIMKDTKAEENKASE